MNIDTDMQWAFTSGVKNYMDERDAYLQSQIGNPEGDDKPNKKFYDPRANLIYILNKIYLYYLCI